MLNMGFIEDIESILLKTPAEKRMLLFSATMPKRIIVLAEKFMSKYKHVKIEKNQLTTHLTDQIYFEVRESDKFEALSRIIDMENNFYALIFCRTRNDVDRITQKLIDRGYDAEGLHGDYSQAQREKIFNQFKNKKLNILVATDVAARGLDVNDLTHVINYSLPGDPENYVHRIGRTGRAGKEGTAITFITPSEYRKLMFIQDKTNTTIRKEMIPRVKDIIKAKKERLTSKISKLVAEGCAENFEDLAKELLLEHSPVEVISALLKTSFKNELNEDNYTEINPGKIYSKDKRPFERSPHDRRNNERGSYNNRPRFERNNDQISIDHEGATRLFIAKGRNDGFDKRKIAEYIAEQTGVRNSDIDDIKVLDAFSFVSVPFEKAEIIIHHFRSTIKGQKPLVTKAKN